MKSDGRLPPVSVEYATMVQTARSFFGSKRTGGSTAPLDTISTPRPAQESQLAITDHELDRLGLAILIAGLSDKQFGLERPDDANPFED